MRNNYTNMYSIIPVVITIDDKYSLPASVAIISLLRNARKKVKYQIIIVTDDLSKRNEALLIRGFKKYNSFYGLIVKKVKNLKIVEIWENTLHKSHFSKEILYRLALADILPEYDKVILTDVDVIFCGDLDESFVMYSENEDWHIAGVKFLNDIIPFFNTYRGFSEETINLLKYKGVSTGYCILNLKQLRMDNMPENYFTFYINNMDNLLQPEQDTISICSYPKLKYLPAKYLSCTFLYSLSSENYKNDPNHSNDELIEAINFPIQIHFVAKPKPWESKKIIHGDKWFYYLTKSPYLYQYLLTKIITFLNQIKKKLKKYILSILSFQIKLK